MKLPNVDGFFIDHAESNQDVIKIVNSVNLAWRKSNP